MTAEEYIAKFPNHRAQNDNCLQDMACPECGSRAMFRITSTIVAEVCDSGTDRDESDCEWDGKSDCRCGECDHSGTVDEFTIEDLDDTLYQMEGEVTDEKEEEVKS
jgi:DNA-directed RNA polymerase subunit RPC12/RpoP